MQHAVRTRRFRRYSLNTNEARNLEDKRDRAPDLDGDRIWERENAWLDCQRERRPDTAAADTRDNREDLRHERPIHPDHHGDAADLQESTAATDDGRAELRGSQGIEERTQIVALDDDKEESHGDAPVSGGGVHAGAGGAGRLRGARFGFFVSDSA